MLVFLLCSNCYLLIKTYLSKPWTLLNQTTKYDNIMPVCFVVFWQGYEHEIKIHEMPIHSLQGIMSNFHFVYFDVNGLSIYSYMLFLNISKLYLSYGSFASSPLLKPTNIFEYSFRYAIMTRLLVRLKRIEYSVSDVYEMSRNIRFSTAKTFRVWQA